MESLYKPPEHLDDMSCFWKDMSDKALQTGICDWCKGKDIQCYFYMPLKEMGEYLAVN